MATCRAHKALKLGGELNCDLTDGHETAMKDHYDATEEVTWNHASKEPASVPYTPTGPIPKLKAKAAL